MKMFGAIMVQLKKIQGEESLFQYFFFVAYLKKNVASSYYHLLMLLDFAKPLSVPLI